MVHELSIDGYILNGDASAPDLRGLENADPTLVSKLVFADDILRSIAEAEANGARVLLVRVGGPGGRCIGSFQMYAALRAFAERGALVVTYGLPGRLASTATALFLAGDLRFLHPEADLLVHSALGGDAVELWNRLLFEIYSTRTATPHELLEAALRCTFTPDGVMQAKRVSVPVALELGWASAAMDEDALRGSLGIPCAARTAPRLEAVLERRDPRGEVATAAVTASKIAAEAIEAQHIKARSITTSMLHMNYGANLFPNGNSLVAPPAGAGADVLGSAEFKFRTEVAANTWRRRLANGESIAHEVVVAEWDRHRASCHVSSAHGRMRMEWLNSAGTILHTEYGSPVNSVISMPALDANGEVVGSLGAPYLAVKLRLVVYASGGSCDFNDISLFSAPVRGAGSPYLPLVEVYAFPQSATSELRLADSGWVAASLNTGFANYYNGHQATRYRKLGGVVHVQLATTRSQAVQDVFTLPAGYRPNGTVGFVGAHGANFMIGYVYSSGVVQVFGNVQNAQIASFSFPADQ